MIAADEQDVYIVVHDS